MTSKIKLLFTAALALLAVGAFVSNAQAIEYSLSLEPHESISSPSLEKLTFTSSAATIRCEITLNGTLSGGLIKLVANLLLGAVTEVSIKRPCVGGEVENALTPIRIILGRLIFAEAEEKNARAVAIQLPSAGFKLTVFGGLVNCLYSGNVEAEIPFTKTGEEEPVRGVRRQDYTAGLARVTTPNSFLRNRERSNELCPERGEMAGTFREPIIRGEKWRIG